MSIARAALHSSRRHGLGVRMAIVGFIMSTATGAIAVAGPLPASASISLVCRVKATFRIGGDDVRGNTSIQISAGGERFIVAGGIPGNTVDSRTGTLSRCISHQALVNGFTITSISNPSWPETTDNWDMTGLSLIDPDTGRAYFRDFGFLMHRFTGQQPSFQTPSIFVRENEPFFDHRYADCSGNQMFARFVDPLRLSNPQFINVEMRRAGTLNPFVRGSFDTFFRDWGGSLHGLGVVVASAASIDFRAMTTTGGLVAGRISAGCNPDGLF